MSYNPKEILEQLEELINDGITPKDSIIIIERRNKIRAKDVQQVYVINTPEAFDMWCPNQRGSYE